MGAPLSDATDLPPVRREVQAGTEVLNDFYQRLSVLQKKELFKLLLEDSPELIRDITTDKPISGASKLALVSRSKERQHFRCSVCSKNFAQPCKLKYALAVCSSTDPP
jgi:hypothetical protein